MGAGVVSYDTRGRGRECGSNYGPECRSRGVGPIMDPIKVKK